MNEIITIGNVRGFIDENGVAQLNAEDIARGFGFTRIATSGNEVIRWERVNGYLKEFGFVPTSGHDVGRDDFIPENMVYRLGFKASNETAQKFQALLADDILPTIRKHGMYATDMVIEQVLQNPDFGIKLLVELKDERNKRKALELQNAQKEQIIHELQPKASYYDIILQSKSVVSIKKIAQDYGMTANKMNKVLNELGVQYKEGGIWLLYKKHLPYGYTKTKTFVVDEEKGKSVISTYWTQKGRLFIYDLLKQNEILPLIEREVGVA